MRRLYGITNPRAARIRANRSEGSRKAWATRRARAAARPSDQERALDEKFGRVLILRHKLGETGLEDDELEELKRLESEVGQSVTDILEEQRDDTERDDAVRDNARVDEPFDPERAPF